MPLSKKNKIAIGASVGGVVLAAAIGTTIYFATKKSDPSPGPGPVPSSTTWSCVDDGQGSSILLANNVPCAKYTTATVCQAAATAGTVSCSCPTSPLQVLQGTSCVPVCLSSATWNNSENKCICPSGTQFNNNTLVCETKCSPPVVVDESTGKATGFAFCNGSCVDVTQVKGQSNCLDALCQSIPCQVSPVCTDGMYFAGFDSTKHACITPNACNGKPYYYTWPDGTNTCPGLTYEQSADGTCVAPDNSALQTACEYTSGGCPGGTQPIQPWEQCSNNISSSVGCRSFEGTATCPAGSTVDNARCASSEKGICYNSATNSCSPAQYDCTTAGLPVSTQVGCRPNEEDWRYNNGICANYTNQSGLQLTASTVSSNVNMVNVVATLPSSNYNVPLQNLQFRYVLTTQGTLPLHWSGVVSTVQINSSNTQQATLTFYPDQSGPQGAVPSGVTLNLFVVGMVQSYDGSWTASIHSPGLSDTNVFTLQLSPDPTPKCLPTVGFAVNKALQLAPLLNNLPPNVQNLVAVTADATTLGLANASNVPYQIPNGGAFAGAAVPVGSYNASGVNQMFIVLAWSPVVNPPSPVTYVVTKNETPLYKGPLTILVDAVSTTATTSVAYSVQAQTSDGKCVSQAQYTTCPPLEYQGALCTSLKNGSDSVINFMIPDPAGSGCTTIPAGDEVAAAYYYCAYLQNKDRSLAGIQVPNTEKTKCMTITKSTEPVMVKSLVENEDATGKPSGYCNNASCTDGYSNLDRMAVCGCAGSPLLCNELMNTVPSGLPYLQLVDTDGITEARAAPKFNEDLLGLATFLQQNKKLEF